MLKFLLVGGLVLIGLGMLGTSITVATDAQARGSLLVVHPGTLTIDTSGKRGEVVQWALVVLQKIKAQQIEAYMNKFHEDKMQNIHLFSAAMILVP